MPRAFSAGKHRASSGAEDTVQGGQGPSAEDRQEDRASPDGSVHPQGRAWRDEGMHPSHFRTLRLFPGSSPIASSKRVDMQTLHLSSLKPLLQLPKTARERHHW